MANSLYSFGRQSFLNGSIDWLTDTIEVALVTSGYVPNISTDQYLSYLGANVVGTAQTLTSTTSSGGVAAAANVTFTSVPSGHIVAYLVIYKSTGSATTSPLIALIDTATGLPASTNGGNINIAWDIGPNKIFVL